MKVQKGGGCRLKKLCIIGQGGHSKVVTDIAISAGYTVAGYLDDKFPEFGVMGKYFYGPVSLAKELAVEKNMSFVIAIGNNVLRKKIVQMLSLPEDRYAVLVHSSASVSPTVKIGCGTVIMPFSAVNASANVGSHAILNTGSVIEHDNQIGDYVHISPHATLTGEVTIGEGTQVGAGATVIPGVQIGKWCMVGAGATVIDHIPQSEKVVGTPARPITNVRL
jgi:acetyltransferase EpsM